MIDGGGPVVQALALAARLGDSKRNRNGVGQQGHPKPQRHRNRQLVADQLQHRRIAEIGAAEVEHRVIADHQPEPLQRRLVEAELLFDFGDEFGIEPLRAAIFARKFRARAGPRARDRRLGAAAEPRRGAGILALHLCDHALNRPARRELHDGEGERENPEQGRDHQQYPARDIGRHQPRAFTAAAFCGSHHHSDE